MPKTIDPQDIPLLTLPSVPFTNRKALPKCAAIYFVLNAEGTVLYIGQSINLAQRWAAHHRTAVLTAKQAVRIAWLVMADAALLDAVEAACLAYFAPLCNGRITPISRHRRPKKSGPKPRGLVHQIHIMVTEDLKAWIEAQPQGASAFLRGLAEAERQRATQPDQARAFDPLKVADAMPRAHV